MAPGATRALTAAATVAVVAGQVALVTTPDRGAAELVGAAALSVAVVVGWVIATHVPSSPVGPALAWTSGSIALVIVNDVLAASAETSDPLPLAAFARHVWVGLWPGNLAGFLALLLVFPDGRPKGRGWLAVPVSFAAGAAAVASAMWDARQVGGVVVGGEKRWQEALLLPGFLLVGGALLAAVMAVVMRYRVSTIRVRLQIRWLLVAGIVVNLLLIGGWSLQALGVPVLVSFGPFLLAVTLFVPAAVGVAIVRHDLFDVDRLLGTGITWLLTLAVSATIFAVTVTLLGTTTGAQGVLGPAAGAFMTAIVLLPLYRTLTHSVGRVIDRDRFVAVERIDRFAAQVRAGKRVPEDIELELRAAQGDPQLRLALARPSGGWSDLRGNPLPTPVGLAVRTGGDTIACLSLGWSTPRSTRRLAALAQAAWVPIEVSRLRLVLRETLTEVEASRARLTDATAAERRRLGRELHDGAQQRILATGMRLRSVQAHLSAHESAEIDLAIAELETTVGELRRISHGIWPSRLDDGLGPALQYSLAASPIPIELRVEPIPPTDAARTFTAYLVVSEAIANALKHAHASHIKVRVATQHNKLQIVVCDNGIGGVPGHGPHALRDRVAAVDGLMRVDSPLGEGTTVTVVL